MSNKLSVIIPYTYGSKLREAALKKLMKCIDAQVFKDFELIVVEEVNTSKPLIDDNEWKKIQTELTTDIPFFKYNNNYMWNKTQKILKENLISKMGKFQYTNKANKYILLENNNFFNKSWCINTAIKKSSYDNILIVDADMLFGKEYFGEVMNFKENNKFFVGYSDIICLPGRDNPVIRVIRSSIKAMGGCWYTSKKFFFNVLGGMNESYYGYGGEDNDIWERADYILRKIPKLDYPVIHQYHHWHPENGAFPLNPKRLDLLKITKRDPKKIISKLKSMNLGKEEGPQEIHY